MRVRKLAAQKTKSGQFHQSPLHLVALLQTRLCKKYNHSDKHFYLKSISWVEKSNGTIKTEETTSNAIKVKDFNTMYEEKERLEKYVDVDSQANNPLSEVINYYKYYQDIPRIHLQKFQKIILKHVEAKRIKKYSDLKFLVQETKETEEIGSYSNFMYLLQEKEQLDSKEKREQQEDTLFCLKEELSSLFKEHSSIQSLDQPKNKETDLKMDTKRWVNLSKITNETRVKKERKNWGSMELRKPCEATGTKSNKDPKKPILRMKTMNTPSSTEKALANLYIYNNQFQKKSNGKDTSRNMVRKTDILTPYSKSRITPSHTRMNSEPFSDCHSKPISQYLLTALQMHKHQASKLKKRRKQDSLLRKEPLRI